MRALVFVLAMMVLGAASPALAADARCYANADYLVIAQERTDDLGTDILVRRDGTIMPCSYEVRQGDVIIGEGDWLWFEALEGHHIVMSRSSGPDGNIVIYDLASPEHPVLDVPAEAHPIVLPQDVIFWERTSEGDAETCPNYEQNTANGLGTAVAEETVFSLLDQSITRTGNMRCVATQ